DVAPLPAEQWSRWTERGDECPGGELDLATPELAGSCIHGAGDEHALGEHDEVELEAGDACSAQARWRHLQAGEQLGARLWVKSYAQPDGDGLIDELVRE
ncbi:MAG: hypothetical protein IAG13_16235, partial [Deltaproteobacteria bacterium]|nr:hypothetical protein [Nannocystaceae bacterium]